MVGIKDRIAIFEPDERIKALIERERMAIGKEAKRGDTPQQKAFRLAQQSIFMSHVAPFSNTTTPSMAMSTKPVVEEGPSVTKSEVDAIFRAAQLTTSYRPTLRKANSFRLTARDRNNQAKGLFSVYSASAPALQYDPYDDDPHLEEDKPSSNAWWGQPSKRKSNSKRSPQSDDGSIDLMEGCDTEADVKEFSVHADEDSIDVFEGAPKRQTFPQPEQEDPRFAEFSSVAGFENGRAGGNHSSPNLKTDNPFAKPLFASLRSLDADEPSDHRSNLTKQSGTSNTSVAASFAEATVASAATARVSNATSLPSMARSEQPVTQPICSLSGNASVATAPEACLGSKLPRGDEPKTPRTPNSTKRKLRKKKIKVRASDVLDGMESPDAEKLQAAMERAQAEGAVRCAVRDRPKQRPSSRGRSGRPDGSKPRPKDRSKSREPRSGDGSGQKERSIPAEDRRSQSVPRRRSQSKPREGDQGPKRTRSVSRGRSPKATEDVATDKRSKSACRSPRGNLTASPDSNSKRRSRSAGRNSATASADDKIKRRSRSWGRPQRESSAKELSNSAPMSPRGRRGHSLGAITRRGPGSSRTLNSQGTAQQSAYQRVGELLKSPFKSLKNVVVRSNSRRNLVTKTPEINKSKVTLRPPSMRALDLATTCTPSSSTKPQGSSGHNAVTEDDVYRTSYGAESVPRAIAVTPDDTSELDEEKVSPLVDRRAMLKRSISDISDDALFRRIKGAGITEEQLSRLLEAGLIITEG